MSYNVFELGLKKAMLRVWNEKPPRYEDRYAILSAFFDSLEDEGFVRISGIQQFQLANTSYVDRVVEAYVYMFYLDQATIEKEQVREEVRTWTEDLCRHILKVLDTEFFTRRNKSGKWVQYRLLNDRSN